MCRMGNAGLDSLPFKAILRASVSQGWTVASYQRRRPRPPATFFSCESSAPDRSWQIPGRRLLHTFRFQRGTLVSTLICERVTRGRDSVGVTPVLCVRREICSICGGSHIWPCFFLFARNGRYLG